MLPRCAGEPPHGLGAEVEEAGSRGYTRPCNIGCCSCTCLGNPGSVHGSKDKSINSCEVSAIIMLGTMLLYVQMKEKKAGICLPALYFSVTIIITHYSTYSLCTMNPAGKVCYLPSVFVLTKQDPNHKLGCLYKLFK